MRIGILADIHDSLTILRWVIDVLHKQSADHLVVLGDVFELGHRLKETVGLLADAGAVGVWGGSVTLTTSPASRERMGDGRSFLLRRNSKSGRSTLPSS
jgi:hypothetical protein